MVKEIPAWLRSYLSLEGASRIERAVSDAEAKTSGEIVPMLVYRSTVSSNSDVLGALFGLLLALCIKHILVLTMGWAGHDLLWSIGFVIAGMSGYMLARLPAVERLLIPRKDQKLETERRAMLAFYEAGLSATEGRTGILLFVSFFERQAVVLADQGIARFCKPEDFQELVHDLVQGAKDHKLVEGFEKAIARCQGILTPHFPPLTSNPNELKDYLRISW
jgi:putative membrane protein